MNKLPLLAALCAALLPAAQAEEPSQLDRLLANRSQSVVSIKFVLKLSITFGGRQQEREMNREVRGVAVDDKGLVMTANSHFDGGLPRQLRRRNDIQVKATPKEIKILFGTDATEFPARLVARDSKLGLAFLQILDLKEQKVTPVDLAQSASPRVGEEYFAITRLARGFDCVPAVSRIRVSARVEKPRPMWAVQGRAAAGLPIYQIDGSPVGVVSVQEGSEGVDEEADDNTAVCILPARTIAATIKSARTRADEMLEEADEAPATENPAPEKAPEDEKPEEPEAPEAPDDK